MRPLEGTRVLDFTHQLGGPFATSLLGDLGCDVIKIEKPGRGDATRYMNISDRYRRAGPEAGSDYFMGINRSKRSITVDLETIQGREIAMKLAKWADVVVQNFRPGVMKKLGLDYEALSEANPSVIYASLSAYGSEGAMARQPAMDVSIQARAGIMSVTGHKGGEPARPGSSLADLSGGMQLVIGILGALLYRTRTGRGQEIQLSLLDATALMMLNYSVAVMDGHAIIEPMGSGHPDLVPFQAFPTSDGFVVIGTGTNKLYRQLCMVLGLAELAEDTRFRDNKDRVRNRTELVSIISERTRQRTSAEWLRDLEEKEIPSAPVNTLQQAFDDPQLKANGMVAEVNHAVHGPIHLLGIPYRYSESTCYLVQPPPTLGQHTEEVLSRTLELSQDAIAQLRTEGVI